MSSVSVNPPKTPVTKGSNGIAAATIPNVCKMPGPPAPFVPVPLPNIGKSGKNPQGYTQDVTIEGNAVAIKGATFDSMGDVASKGTGGGLISANCEGITKFVGPGSMDVKFEGGNVQFLSDPMLNNCGPSGSPPNAATMQGIIQASSYVTIVPARKCPICEKDHGAFEETPESRVSADALAKAYKEQKGETTMLAVVHCSGCELEYADKSGRTDEKLCNAAKSSGCEHQDIKTVQELKGSRQITDPADGTKRPTTPAEKIALQQAPFKKILGDRFESVWQQGKTLNNEWRKNATNLPAAYEPGFCAGPKALVLLLDRGGLPKSMTEQFYSSDGEGAETGGKILHLDHKHQKWTTRFKHGKSTPPCKTCTLLLPYMLCSEDKIKCSDKKTN